MVDLRQAEDAVQVCLRVIDCLEELEQSYQHAGDRLAVDQAVPDEVWEEPGAGVAESFGADIV